jgi:hypothetical protein
MENAGHGAVSSLEHAHTSLFPTHDTDKAEVRKRLRDQDVSYRQGLENFIVR